jgi:hypothetical protein
MKNEAIDEWRWLKMRFGGKKRVFLTGARTPSLVRWTFLFFNKERIQQRNRTLSSSLIF